MHRNLFLICLLFLQSNLNNNNNLGVLAQIDDSTKLQTQQRLPITEQDSTLITRKKEGTMSTTPKPKNSWPELIGIDGPEAKAKLEAMEPNKTIVLVPEGHMVTMDYRTDRIRIFLDSEGKVSRAPIIG